jgi:hypothetical protein
VEYLRTVVQKEVNSDNRKIVEEFAEGEWQPVAMKQNE